MLTMQQQILNQNTLTEELSMSQYITDGFLKVMFFKTQENSADIFTKNVSGDILNKHVEHYVINKKEM